jgi:hypothetical protein
MASYDQISPIPDTILTAQEVKLLEAALGESVPDDLKNFVMSYGYASFSDVGFGDLTFSGQNAAFGQFYGRRPGVKYDPYDFKSGALRIGDAESHYPPQSLIFAGDELGGEYFFGLGQSSPGIYWMIYGPDTDYIWVCGSFTQFIEMIEVNKYDDE